MIIDAHTHYGRSFWGNFSPEFLMSIIDESIDYCICSNLEGIDAAVGKDELECNLDMLEVAKKYKKIKPLVVCEVDRTQNANRIEELLLKYPEIVGLKFHPEFTKLVATSEKYDSYLRLAELYKKPCLFHSGHINSKYSSPILIYEKAKEFPTVPIILGHLSTGDRKSHQKAIDIMVESIEKDLANLYVDTSWVEIDDVILLIEALKQTTKGDCTDRIMWASDAPVGDFNQKKDIYQKNLATFQKKILEYFQDKHLLENLMTNNARKLFGF